MIQSLQGVPVPALTQEILEDPAPFVRRLVEQMREYWKLAIEPHWPRIRALHEADVTYRARQLALGRRGAALRRPAPLVVVGRRRARDRQAPLR